MHLRKQLAESLHALKLLNLNNIKRKLMEPAPEGKGWTQAQADDAEKWYRRFLEIIVRYPSLNTVPNYVIDMFWHQHILDTRAYAEDCERIFGVFIHHYPYFGLNGDEAERDRCFDETDAVYQRLFGESCRKVDSFMDAAGCHGQTCNTSACRADDPAIPRPPAIEHAQSCNHSGSGTGCGQRCSRGMIAHPVVHEVTLDHTVAGFNIAGASYPLRDSRSLMEY